MRTSLPCWLESRERVWHATDYVQARLVKAAAVDADITAVSSVRHAPAGAAHERGRESERHAVRDTYPPVDLPMQLSDVRHHVGDLAFSHGRGLADAVDYRELAASLRALADACETHAAGVL